MGLLTQALLLKLHPFKLIKSVLRDHMPNDVCVTVSFVLFAGRLFDFHVLDMIELGIEKYVSLSDVKVMVAVIHITSVLSD